MYRIIGADDKEYGPVAEENIREWIKEGRANSQTKVQAEGSSDWKALGDLQEFAALLSGAAGSPPVLPVTPPQQGKLSALAVTSLVLGALGLFTLGLTSGANWCDALGKYVGNRRVFQCPAANPNQPCGYAFIARLAGVDTKRLADPAQTVLFFEADGGWNLSGGPELLLSLPRHRNAIGIAFADGHCEIRPRARLGDLRWEP